MTVIHAAEAPVFDIPGARFTRLASPTCGTCDNSVWRVRMRPGTEPRFHRVTREEIFVVLEGAAQLHMGGAVRDLVPGSTAIVPADTDFALANPGAAPFEAIVVFPVGGQAVLDGQAPFTPPWAQ